jgi:leader peptidase (prepilin peptidase) / N-methyltransferase
MLFLSKILLVIAAPFMGSFLGAVIVRWSSGRPLYSSRATCDCGQVVLSPRDMIPIASWAVSRGRCRICARGLGRLYPAIEIAALIIALWSIIALPGADIWTGAAFGWALLVIGMIFWRDGKLPMAVVVGVGIAGLLLAGSNGFITLRDHFLAAVIAFAAYFVLARLLNHWQQRQFARPGDAVLPAALGAWLGWQGLPDLLVLSMVAALALILLNRASLPLHRDRMLAASLCAGAWLAWLYPLGLVT